MLERPTCYVQWKPPSRAYKLYHMLQNHQCLFLNVVVALIKLLDYLSLVQTDNPNWNLMFHHLHWQENGSKNLRQIILFFIYFHLDSILLQSIFLGDFLPVQVGLFHSMYSKDIKIVSLSLTGGNILYEDLGFLSCSSVSSSSISEQLSSSSSSCFLLHLLLRRFHHRNFLPY